MSQTLTLKRAPTGIDSAKLFNDGTDTIATNGVANTVTPGTNNPTRYSITWNSTVAAGRYQLLLYDGGLAVAGTDVDVTASGVTEVSDTTVVLPVTATIESRSVDGRIIAFVGEEIEVALTCDQSIDGLTLNVIVEDFSGADVGIISSVTASSQTATFTVGSPYTDEVGQFRFSIREVGTGVVFAKGLLLVKYAARAD